MSVSIATALPPIAFSKNDLYLVIQSDAADYLSGAPSAAVNYYEFDAAVAALTAIDISWITGGVTMTAEVTPDGSGTQFPAGDGSAGYVTSLIPYFQANYFIDQSFVVTADTTGEFPRLIFTARQQGAGYNSQVETSAGIITPGVDNTPIANFAHHTEPWIDDGTGNYVQVFSENIPLDYPYTGKTSIDLHDALHSFLSPDYPVMTALYQKCTQSIRKYFIKYAQFFGSIPAIQAIKYSATQVITMGGLGMQPSLIRNIMTELCPGGEDLTQNRFLRQGSKNKLVTTAQPEWLSYINLSGAPQTVSLEVTINNADDSATVFTPVAGLVINAYEKYQFQAGFTQLAMLTRQSPDLAIVYYTVRLKTGDGYITDVYNFVVDYEYREFPRYFVYTNSYGAPQTLGTVGKGQLEYDRAKTDAEQSMDRQTAAMDGDFLETNITIQQKGTVNIGYDRAGTRNTMLLRDLLLSRSNFLYQNGVLIPIGFNTKNLKDALDGVSPYANQLQFFFLYEEEVWTEDWPLVDDNLLGLISEAGSATPPNLVPPVDGTGAITVLFGDLNFNPGPLTYTMPYYLAGKIGYPIYSTGMDGFFKPGDVTYDILGSFTIVVPGFTWSEGDELIIWPTLLEPPI